MKTSPSNSANPQALREQLKSFVSYEDGAKIRRELHLHALKTYKPKYADRYLGFMNQNECVFSVNHPQDCNHPYYMTLFTVKSQHVMGDCVEECLDFAIEA